MAISTAEILDVMREHGVVPDELPPGLDLPTGDGPGLPGVGEVEEGETVYATSIGEVFGDDEDVGENAVAPDDPRIREWWEEVRPIVESTGRATAHRVARRLEGRSAEPPEPHCAWYSPIHFFGHGWGIYIRERCVLEVAADVAAFVDWSRVHLSPPVIAQQLLRSAFYAFFLHEQFHHKVESLGLRLLVSTDSDRYPALWKHAFAPADRTPDQHDAYSAALWLQRADRDGTLGRYLQPRLSQDDMVIAGVEGRLLRGDLTRLQSNTAEPQRRRRNYKRVNHEAVAKRLEDAIKTGEKLADVAADLGVSVATLSRHTELYDAVRDALERDRYIVTTARRRAALAQVEKVLISCARAGVTPSLRNASRITGDIWHVGQLRSVSLVMLRIALGDTRVKLPTREASMGWEHRNMLAASVKRVLAALEPTNRLASSPLAA